MGIIGWKRGRFGAITLNVSKQSADYLELMRSDEAYVNLNLISQLEKQRDLILRRFENSDRGITKFYSQRLRGIEKALQAQSQKQNV